MKYPPNDDIAALRSPNASGKRKRILLGQLEKLGDCLYASVIARQIKNDYQNCHLTWAVNTTCLSVVENNPYVDEIWELKRNPDDSLTLWQKFVDEALLKKERGEYDLIFFAQILPDNFKNYDGTVRSSIFRGYPKPISVPIAPIVRLSDPEIENVARFAKIHKLKEKKHVILFEYDAASGQSFVTQDFAIDAAKIVLKKYPNVVFILTSNTETNEIGPNIIDGSILSFKENAELTKYCTLLVGCSSGISWLATSDWAKPLPKIQLLKTKTYFYASMMHDAIHFGLPTDQLLEMQDCTPPYLADCIKMVLKEGFSQAKRKYHKDIPLKFDFYFYQLYLDLLSKNKFLEAAMSLKASLDKYSNHKDLISFNKNILLPNIGLYWSEISLDDRIRINKLVGSPKYSSGDNLFLRNIKIFMGLSVNYISDKNIIALKVIRKKIKDFFISGR